MDDERDQDAQRAPLWPADAPQPAPERSAPPNPWEAAARPWDAPPEPPNPPAPSAPSAPSAPPEPPSISDQPTMRVSAAPAASISDQQTMRVSVPPAEPTAPPAQPAPSAVTAQASAPADAGAVAPPPRLEPQVETPDAPTQRISAAPPIAPASAAPAAPPVVAPQPTPAPAPRKRASHWRLWVTLAIIVVLVAGAGGLYSYASSLAAEPTTLMARYCGAITRDDYRAAYGLLAASAQAQEAEPQYLADAAARDAIEGPVTRCVSSPTQTLSPLSFLRAPRSIIFNAQITRKQAASGQIALSRDARGWHVAALSSHLQGIDLGPLATEQALCQAFGQRAYDQAYALLSTPYQKEQGDATTFAHAFGSTLTISGCAPDLKTYSVNSADQQASVNATLSISVAGVSSPFTLPATVTFVREATGWRVDAITPRLSQ